MGQKFHPPRIFGQWKEKEGTPEWRRKDIGMKIVCRMQFFGFGLCLIYPVGLWI